MTSINFIYIHESREKLYIITSNLSLKLNVTKALSTRRIVNLILSYSDKFYCNGLELKNVLFHSDISTSVYGSDVLVCLE